jgi:hypothetical protein
MPEYHFIRELADRFHSTVKESRSGAGHALCVAAVREIADQIASEFAEGLRADGRTAEVVARYPDLLERRSPRAWDGATVGESIRELVVYDITRILDVRQAWADQFADDYPVEGELIAAANAAIQDYLSATAAENGLAQLQKLGYGEDKRAEISQDATVAVSELRADGGHSAARTVIRVLSPVVLALRALGRKNADERFVAAAEAFLRLGRAPDGSWVMAH